MAVLPGVTNLPVRTRGWRGQLAYIDAAHRVHARPEDAIRTGKDCGIGRFPSHYFALRAEVAATAGPRPRTSRWPLKVTDAASGPADALSPLPPLRRLTCALGSCSGGAVPSLGRSWEPALHLGAAPSISHLPQPGTGQRPTARGIRAGTRLQALPFQRRSGS